MTVRVDKAVCVHEPEILRLIVSRTTSRKGFGNQFIYLFAAPTAKIYQDFNGLTGIADGFGRELTELGVGTQHDKNCITDNDARSGVVAELLVVDESKRLEEANRPLEVSDREVEENLVDHANLL